MTQVTGTARDAAGDTLAGVPVTASLFAASYQRTAGGQVVRDPDPAESGDDGTWTLELEPVSALSVPDGAYYVVRVGDREFYAVVPDSGPVELGAILTEPAPLPDTGATTAALATEATARAAADLLRWRVVVWDGSAYVNPDGSAFTRGDDEIVAFLGGPTDPTSADGDLWISTGA